MPETITEPRIEPKVEPREIPTFRPFRRGDTCAPQRDDGSKRTRRNI